MFRTAQAFLFGGCHEAAFRIFLCSLENGVDEIKIACVNWHMIPSTLDQLAAKIAEAMAATKPKTRQRNDALAAIRWRLESASGLVAGLDDTGCCILCPADSPLAQVFDGRDNEVMKQRMYQMLLGEPLTLVLL